MKYFLDLNNDLLKLLYAQLDNMDITNRFYSEIR